MKQIRLLPVVIAAAAALFLLKVVGIATDGGYVLTGTGQVQAAGAAPSNGHGNGASSGAGFEVPDEQTLRDTTPTLDDGAPTMMLPSRSADEPEDAEGDEDAHAEISGGVEEIDAASAHDQNDSGHSGDVAEIVECPPGSVPVAPGQDGGPGFDFSRNVPDCVVDPGVNEAGDALPLIRDGGGTVLPLAIAEGAAPSSEAIIERLNLRRAELDQREAELEMRLALIEAAEKRIGERTIVLEQLEARINAMVDEKRTLEESQFTAVVAMYETMRPRDASAIFDQLEMPILLRVARGINPRKMAPIMANMNPSKARDLTAALAVDQVEPTIDLSKEDFTQLPQIVGQ